MAVTWKKLFYDSVSATSRILGRKTAGAGVVEELTGAEVTALLSAASTTAAGVVEIAIGSEVDTGTDAGRAISPDALAGSLIFGVAAIEKQITGDATDVDTVSGIGYFIVPQKMNGMNLIRATAYVITAGTTNATTIQIRNLTKYASNDALSTAISIASAGNLATAGTVNTLYDDMSTNDVYKFYVTANSTTKPKGLYVIFEAQLP